MTTPNLVVPPNSLDAERSLLGAMLYQSEAVDIATESVNADDFYKPAHAHVFDAILVAHEEGRADPVTVSARLDAVGLLGEVGGRHVLTDMVADAPIGSKVEHLAGVIADLSTLRRMGTAARDITELAMNGSRDVEAAVTAAEHLIDGVTAHASRAKLVPIGDALAGYRERMDTPFDGTPTGFAGLDDRVGGWLKGALNLIGAPSGVGKSSAVVVSIIAACRAGRPVMVNTLEMSTDEFINRIVAVVAGLDFSKVVRRQLTKGERQARADALDEMEGWVLDIDDNPAPTVGSIRARARQLRRIHGEIGLHVFDYLQLWSLGSRENRQAEVAAASRALKQLAGEMEMPVLVAVQLNNQSASRSDKRPEMHDIRESSAPYHDSSVVAFLYREGFYDEHVVDPNETELILKKNRNGPTGRCIVDWVPKHATFVDRPETTYRPQPPPTTNGSVPAGVAGPPVRRDLDDPF